MIMPARDCDGKEIKNEVDEFLDSTEDMLSSDNGSGSLSEDMYNKALADIEEMRSVNNRIKCLVATIPRSSADPEAILDELKSLEEK